MKEIYPQITQILQIFIVYLRNLRIFSPPVLFPIMSINYARQGLSCHFYTMLYYNHGKNSKESIEQTGRYKKIRSGQVEIPLDDLSKLIEQIKQLSGESQGKLADYIAFLQWQEAQRRAQAAKGWSFSFIEAFKEASIQASQGTAGMDVKMAPATVGGVSRPALWAHPPVVGQAVIEYHVPIPQQVADVQLCLAVGVRDGAKISEDNLVAFSVRINGIRVWGRQSNKQTWQEVEIPLDLSVGDITRIEFRTEALGNHQWTWAVWGNPELSGKLIK